MADVENPAAGREGENVELEERDEQDEICLKLKPAEHLRAVLDGNLDLYRSAVAVDCDPNLLEQVFGNSLILSNILKYLPWQDKFVCKEVSTSWQSTVTKLGKKQLRQVDFSINLGYIREGILFKKSGVIYTVPLCVLVFCNAEALQDYATVNCMAVQPHPCKPSCEKDHSGKKLLQNILNDEQIETLY